MNYYFNRLWQRRIVVSLILINVSIGITGVYALSTSPILFPDNDTDLISSHHTIQKIAGVVLGPTFFYRLPEFFLPSEEAMWWDKEANIGSLLAKNKSVTVELTGVDGMAHTVEAVVGSVGLVEAVKRTGLLYLIALIYIISAVWVFSRHHSTPGWVLTFFLLFGGLYLMSSAPVVNRTITLPASYFKSLIIANYVAGAGLITLVHFAFVFPRPKKIIEKAPKLSCAVFYGYALLTTVLYLLGIVAFASSTPFLFLWSSLMIGAFVHSLIMEEDAFFRKQIFLSLLAPLLTTAIFILFHVLPGILGTSSMRFSYFALFTLILPFALPSALDNSRFYQERIDLERKYHMEKGKMGKELHDNLSNDLTNIKFLSEVAEKMLPDGSATEKTRESIRLIKETSLRNMERLRDFFWAIDPDEDACEDMIAHFNSYASKLFNSLDIDFVLKHDSSSRTPCLNTYLRFNLFSIYKEAVSNIIKHSKAKKVEIEIRCEERSLEMKIADDGQGFKPNSPSRGHRGLINMGNRAKDIGATLNISSEEGKGTLIHLILREI